MMFAGRVCEWQENDVLDALWNFGNLSPKWE
ncbi:hypothetical protein Pan258_29340 [Symmachiella dynata]|nr:hypothetical protein Pan258_29340 [Symmachiella dynata]